MSKANKWLSFFLKFQLLVTIAFTSLNMGLGERRINTTPSPEFIELDEDQPNYRATVYEGEKKTDVEELSFAGDTKLIQLLQEGSNARIDLDLRYIKEIRIVDKSYHSKEHADQDFVRAEFTTVHNTHKKYLLIPRHTNVSGVTRDELHARVGWYIYNIDKIAITSQPSGGKS